MTQSDFGRGVSKAIREFWLIRESQALKQGRISGRRDTGSRSAVTGGAQMNGFVNLIRELLVNVGVPKECIHDKGGLELPGWFRAEKSWDLVIVLDGRLVASLEFKSQVGPSFGNNFNNRTEEALGSATDLWAAFREGAFRPSAKPWLGYLMLLEETEKSTRGVRVKEPSFPVFPEFQESSYAKRYEILLTKLLRERLYDGTCFIMSDKTSGQRGKYREPSDELAFSRFAESLLGRALAAIRT